MSTNKKIGTLIRRARKKAKLTQKDVADKLGFSTPMFVCMLENGKSKIPVSVLGSLIVILGLPKKEILAMLIEDYKGLLLHDIKVGEDGVKI